MRRMICVAVCVVLSACGSMPQKDLPYVRASDVIDALKDELQKVRATPFQAKVIVNENECGMSLQDDQGHPYRAVLLKVHSVDAEVTLKTVATDSIAGTAGGSKVPVNVVVVSPSLTVTRTGIKTQQVTYSFTGSEALTNDLSPEKDDKNKDGKPTQHVKEVDNTPYKPVGQKKRNSGPPAWRIRRSRIDDRPSDRQQHEQQRHRGSHSRRAR